MKTSLRIPIIAATAAALLIVGAPVAHASDETPTTSDQLSATVAPYEWLDHYMSPVWAVAYQPDGKVVIGGTFQKVRGQNRNSIARLNADGALDKTFNRAGAGATTASKPGSVSEVVLQRDGKILIGGQFDRVHGQARAGIARLNTDGTLDTSFTASVNFTPDQIIPLADGKILVAGSRANNTGAAVRLLSNGRPDATFAAPALNGAVRDVEVQGDGKVLLFGRFTVVAGARRTGVVRLNTNGTLDTKFSPVITAPGAASLLFVVGALQADGKILIGGSFNAVNGKAAARAARLNADGTTDRGFSLGALPVKSSATPVVTKLTPQRDGKILLVVQTKDVHEDYQYVVRVSATGAADTSFTPAWAYTFAPGAGSVTDIELHNDGRILVSGLFPYIGPVKGQPSQRSGLALLNTNGLPDSRFLPGR
jgi:uncharacterized delta-60 repeat protein